MKLAVLPLAVAAATVACGTSGEARLATALAGTRSAESFRSTSAVSTARARATRTPTLRPPTPTRSPTPDIAATLERLSSVTLTGQDLPEAFHPISFEEMGTSEAELKGMMAEGDLSVGDAFLFLDDTHFQFVLGWTVLLPDRLTRAGFDAEVSRPETILDLLASSFQAEEITDKRLLSGATSIGDVSAGMTVATRFSDVPLPMRMDVVVFRNESLGAILFEMYVDGEDAQAPILDIASLLAERMTEAQR